MGPPPACTPGRTTAWTRQPRLCAAPAGDGSLPAESWINQGLDWVVTEFPNPFFQTVRGPIDGVLTPDGGLAAKRARRCGWWPF